MIKKIVLFSLCPILALLSYAGYGQSELLPFRYGIKIGMTSSTFARDFQPLSTPRIAPLGGFSAEYQIIDILSVSIDALYIGHGVSNRQISSNPLVEESLAMHGIDAPLVVNIYPLGIGSRTIPNFFAGHSFGFNLYDLSYKYYQIGELNGVPFFAKSMQNVTSDYKLLDFGVLVGTGILILSERGSISIDFSYRVGYMDITNQFGKISTNTALVSFTYWL